MARQTKLPSIPRLNTKDTQLSKFSAAVFELMEVWRGNKNYGDKVVTVNDLVDSGGFTAEAAAGSAAGGALVFSGEVSVDATPPGAVTGLVVSAGLTSAFITFSLLTATNIAYYEIWRNVTNTFDGGEVRIGTTVAALYTDAIGDTSKTYYYWIRAVNLADIAGPFNATLGTSGTTGAISLTNFASGITPVEIVATLPTTGNFTGRQALLTTDNKLYRYNGTAWTNAVDGADIAANTIVAGSIAVGAITATELAANAVTAVKIAAGVISADKMNVSQLSAIAANLGTITAGSLNINSRFIVDATGNTTITSSSTGERLEIKNNVIKVYDSSSVKRVQIGDLTA